MPRSSIPHQARLERPRACKTPLFFAVGHNLLWVWPGACKTRIGKVPICGCFRTTSHSGDYDHTHVLRAAYRQKPGAARAPGCAVKCRSARRDQADEHPHAGSKRDARQARAARTSGTRATPRRVRCSFHHRVKGRNTFLTCPPGASTCAQHFAALVDSCATPISTMVYSMLSDKNRRRTGAQRRIILRFAIIKTAVRDAVREEVRHSLLPTYTTGTYYISSGIFQVRDAVRDAVREGVF